MSKKILIVEGDPSVSAEVKGELENKGFVVEQISDSKRVIETMRADKPALVILGVELSAGQNGYLVCGKIRKDDELKNTPIVILGSPEGFAQHRKLKTRADEYVAKPIDSGDLSQKIGGLIGFPETSSVEIIDESLTLSDLVDAAEPGAAEIVEEDSPLPARDAEASSGQADSELEMFDAAFDQMSVPSGEKNGLFEEPVEAPPETAGDPEEAELEPLNGSDLSAAADAALDSLAAEVPMSSTSEVSIEIDEAALSELGEESANVDSDAVPPRSESNRREILKLKSDLNRREKEVLDLREREIKLEQDVAHGSGDLARKDAQVKTLSARVDQMTNERKKLEQQLTAAREESRSAASKLSSLQRELSELRADQADAKKALDEVASLQRELELLRSDAQGARREAEDARGELESVKSQLTNQSEEGASLRRRVVELEEATQKHEERVAKFYQKLKDDDKIRQKTKKALSIALHLLDEQQRVGLETDDEPAEA